MIIMTDIQIAKKEKTENIINIAKKKKLDKNI